MTVRRLDLKWSQTKRWIPGIGFGKRLAKAVRIGLAALILGGAVTGCVHHTDLSEMTPEQRRKRLAAVRPDWTQHFEDLSKGAILISIQDRWLVYWEPGGARSHAFPIAVPLNDDLTKTGVTQVVRRKELPSWTATPEMIERNPEVPRYIGPGPHNPLGEHALYLGWRFYAIHGTNTPGAIGDRATSGCFRLFSEDIKWLFDNVSLGTPVKVMYSAEVEEVPRENLGVSGVPSRTLPPSARAENLDENGVVTSTPILDNPGETAAPSTSAPVYPPSPDGRVYSRPILDNPPASSQPQPLSEEQRSQPSPIGFNRG